MVKVSKENKKDQQNGLYETSVPSEGAMDDRNTNESQMFNFD